MKNNIHNSFDPSKILNKWNFNIDEKSIMNEWDKPYRFYHTSKNHMFPMIYHIMFNYSHIDSDMLEALIIATYFHDIVYNPKSKTNEEDSIKFMYNHCDKPQNPLLKIVENLIIKTKTHKPTCELSKMFCKADFSILQESPIENLIYLEKQVFNEYGFVNWEIYQKKRIDLLKRFLNINYLKWTPDQTNKINSLIGYIRNQNPRIGVYAGSFNPFHIGHADIVKQAIKIFDKVIIAKGINPEKQRDDLATIKIIKNLNKLYPNMEIVKYDGLLTDFLKSQKGDITLIRGLRDSYDLYEETKFRLYMQDMYQDLKVVYLPCHPSLAHISSSSIRMIQNYEQELVKKYLP